MRSSAFVGALRQPALWAFVAFLALVAAEVYYWVDERATIPGTVTGSVFYPVALVLLGYVFVFSGTDHYRNFKALVTAGSFAFAVASLFLLSKRPKLFDDMAVEDGLVENLSAFAFFVGAAAFVVLAVRLFRRRGWLVAVLALLFGVVLFVIGMEEISWMQRILEIETSEYFLDKNIQNEMNFHNLNTGVSEKAFYFGGFISLIVFPYFHTSLKDFFERVGLGSLSVLLPAQWLLLPSSLMVGYVGTNVLRDPTGSIAALVAALMLFRFTVKALYSGDFGRFAVYGAFLVLVGVMTYYFTTYNYALVDIRSWARKEYLELVIAIGLMAYAVSALQSALVLNHEKRVGESSSKQA